MCLSQTQIAMEVSNMQRGWQIQHPALAACCENSFLHNGLFQIWFPSRTFFLAHWSKNNCWKLLQKFNKEDINNLIFHTLFICEILQDLLPSLLAVKCFMRNFCGAFIISRIQRCQTSKAKTKLYPSTTYVLICSPQRQMLWNVCQVWKEREKLQT